MVNLLSGLLFLLSPLFLAAGILFVVVKLTQREQKMVQKDSARQVHPFLRALFGLAFFFMALLLIALLEKGPQYWLSNYIKVLQVLFLFVYSGLMVFKGLSPRILTKLTEAISKLYR